MLDGNLEIKGDIEEQLSKISDFTKQIEEYEMQILELRDLKQCDSCKNKIDRSAKFCPECGAEQPVEEVHEAEVVDQGEEEVNPENEEEENSNDSVDEEASNEDKKE